MSFDPNIFKQFLFNKFDIDVQDGEIYPGYNPEHIVNYIIVSLIETNAVIAGGSVLAAYTYTNNIKDLDIYVNKKNAIKLRENLAKLKYNFASYNIQSQYDQSFFIKNNILARFTLMMHYKLPTIDIMIVPDNIDVRQVVTNFDLTFCEIWYDGINVYASNPKDFIEKKGTLKSDYLENLLLNFNKFTINRIKKYIRKGFTISYNTQNKNHIISEKQAKKKPINSEKWVVNIIYRTILKLLDENLLQKYINNIPISSNVYNLFCISNIDDYSVKSLMNFFNFLQVSPDINTRIDLIITILSYSIFETKNHNYYTDIFNVFKITKDQIDDRYDEIKNEDDEEEEEEEEEVDEEDIRRINFLLNTKLNIKRKREDDELIEEEVESRRPGPSKKRKIIYDDDDLGDYF